MSKNAKTFKNQSCWIREKLISKHEIEPCTRCLYYDTPYCIFGEDVTLSVTNARHSQEETI